MKGIPKVFTITFLIVWIFYLLLVGMTAFLDMDLDKTKEYWCENGFDDLDCGYSLRWVLCLSVLIASMMSVCVFVVFHKELYEDANCTKDEEVKE